MAKSDSEQGKNDQKAPWNKKAKSDSEQGKNDQKAPWNKRAQNLRAVKTKKETKEKTENIQGGLTKRVSPPAQLLQKQVEDNTKKQKFRTYFSENVQSKEKKADVSCQVVVFFSGKKTVQH